MKNIAKLIGIVAVVVLVAGFTASASTLGSTDYTSPVCIGYGQQSANQACHNYSSQPIMCGVTQCGEYYSVGGGVNCAYTVSSDPDSCDDEVTGTGAPSPAYPNVVRSTVSGSYTVGAHIDVSSLSGSVYGNSAWPSLSPGATGPISSAWSTDSLSASGQFNGLPKSGNGATAHASYSITSCANGYTASVGACTPVAICTISTWTNSPKSTLTWATSNCTSASVTYPGGSSTSLSGTVSTISTSGTCTITAQPGNVTAATINPCGPVAALGATLNDTGTATESATIRAGGSQTFNLTVSNTGDHCSSGSVTNGQLSSSGGTGGTKTGYVNPGSVVAPCP